MKQVEEQTALPKGELQHIKNVPNTGGRGNLDFVGCLCISF